MEYLIPEFRFTSRTFEELQRQLEKMYDDIYREMLRIDTIDAETYVNYVDRGDPASVDFDEGDLTTTGLDEWRDLDLSSIVTAGAKAVVLNVLIVDDATNSQLQFRKNGNSNVNNVFRLRTQVIGHGMQGMGIVSCDTSRVIEYAGSNLTFTSIDITVCGWFI